VHCAPVAESWADGKQILHHLNLETRPGKIHATIAIFKSDMVANRRRNELAPRRPPENLPSLVDLTPVIDEIVLAGLPLEESYAQNIELSGRKIPSLVAWNSLFDRVSFASCEISSFRLRDVRLVKCDLSNAILHGFEASRVELIECRLIGMRAIECHWQDVLVENCDMRYAQLSDGKARSCEFRECHLGETDLRGADLEGAIFANVLLHRADLSRAKLRGADLRGAEIEGITVRAEDLRGAIVSVVQAVDLARLLGLIIK
jgi:uncharacterized protein YjbI with pentapeptide repeats